MRRLTAGIIAAAALITIAPSAAAEGACGTATPFAVGDDTFYIDERPSQDFIPVSGFGIYRESNGIEGLQRGGSWDVAGVLYHWDDCNDGSAPDTLII